MINDHEKYNNIFLGIIIGAGLIFLLMWYTNRQEKSDDWWCSYLPNDDAKYCHNLYKKATRKIDERSDYEEQCTPDYMGGCN